MSGDEVSAALAGSAIALVFWTRWYYFLLMTEARPGAARLRLLMAAAPALALAGLHHLLTRWASHDVVDDPVYIGFYLTLGAAWLALGALAFGVLGLPMRD